MKSCSAKEKDDLIRHLLLTDLFFLLWFGCGRKDMEHDWIIARCHEVRDAPDGHLDLWAREHYKSTIITFGRTIQDILNDPEETFGIFSHSRPIAKAFLRQIKQEFEGNSLLKAYFPGVLWPDPKSQAPKWSEDEGIVVIRKGNPKEATVEAWGLVDGQPTSKHFGKLLYDDIVTEKSVTTPDMIKKTTDSLALSYNLGKRGGARRFIGTRYHFNDTYASILERGTARPRVYPATDDGTPTGEPVLLTSEELAEKRRDQGPYIFGAQMMQNPIADEMQGFKTEWLRYYKDANRGARMNRYILVDAANEKRKNNDWTAMWVVGLGPDSNFYALDFVRDRLNLTQRAEMLFELHEKWAPIVEVRYEKYGLMADVQHMRDRMERENYRFEIIEVGGITPKNDRIKRLLPVFEQGRFWLPRTLYRTLYDGSTVDLVSTFVEQEYKPFPVPRHDDAFDALARIEEPGLTLKWPKQQKKPDGPKRSHGGRKHGWMAA